MWSFVGNFQSSDKKIEKTKIHNFGNCFTENFEIIFFLKNISWKKPRQIINTYHTEVKYSIAGVEFQATKQFILSSFGMQLYLSWWSNGLRHQTNSQKAVGSIPTRGDFFLNVYFSLCRICFPQILLIASMTSTNLGWSSTGAPWCH